ncbi:MAG: Uncharacterised protein [Gammaproteobacteria bacterium]|nr:MAG: Uncharacterised protein [Gammaproteobacteria bacterium]|tara:strand:- start:785 stop:1285 length:501 start_codon:yes stop_codon:yes gene_type:complete
MNNISKIIDCITERMSNLLIIAVLLMIALIFFSIIFRFLFNINSIAIQELVMYLHAFVFLFGLSYAIKKNTHVKIDIIYSKLSKRYKTLVSIIGLFFFIIPTSVFIIYISLDMVGQSWLILEGSSEANGLDLVFVLKSFIPLMGLLIFLQSISEIIKYVEIYINEC